MFKLWIKRLLGLALFTLLAGGLVYALLPKPVPVDLAAATIAPLQVTVEEDGRTRIRDKFMVSAPLAGKLGRVRFKPGARVKPGQIVASIEPSDPNLLDPRARAQAEARVKGAKSTVDRANSAIEAAQVAVQYAESEFARAEDLWRRKALSPADYDAKATDHRLRNEEFRVARHSREIAQFELELAEAALLRTRPTTSLAEESQRELFELRAPPAAADEAEFVVLRVLQESEAVVSAGQQVLELGDPADLEIEIDLLSADAVKVRPGTRVWLEQWGGDQPLEARVRLVEPAGFTKISALGVEEQRVNVLADFPTRESIPATLGDQFRVEARLVLWEEERVLQVPTSALFRSEEGWALFRVEGDKAVLTPVKVGHKTGLAAQILEGLAEGDRVIIHPGDRVANGVEISIRPGSLPVR